jgi:unsaturated rhamnogalacturonyl hydrolase
MSLPLSVPEGSHAMTTTSEQLLGSAADALLTLGYRAWRFGDSVAFEAMVEASRCTGEDRWRSFIHGFVRCWFASVEDYVRLDCTAPGLAMVRIAEDTGDSAVLDGAAHLADYLLSRPTYAGAFLTFDRASLHPPFSGEALSEHDQALLADPPAGVYVDCLHFDPPFLAALGRATGSTRYTQAAAEQALAYVRLLQDPATGLFYHFALAGEQRPYMLGWGRGQGWALLGLTDVLALLPSDHPARPELAAATVALIDALLRRQRDDGSWYTLLDHPDSGAESTTAAFACIGMGRAADLGLLAPAVVDGPRRRAARAVLADVRDGVLHNGSDAVLSSTVVSHYKHVPVDVVTPWSQGPLVLMLASLPDLAALPEQVSAS